MNACIEIPLWTAARAMFARMRAAVGETADLAARWIGPKERREIQTWLGPLIAMVRKIVLIEAIALLPRLDRASSDAHRQRRANAQPKACGPRKPAIRLWPRPARNTGPRIRQLGPPLLVAEIWRADARAAAAWRLRQIRFMRRAAGVEIARRVEALARLLKRPLGAARRLARKLRASRQLTLKLALRPLPRTRRYPDDAYPNSGGRACACAMALLYPNTS